MTIFFRARLMPPAPQDALVVVGQGLSSSEDRAVFDCSITHTREDIRRELDKAFPHPDSYYAEHVESGLLPLLAVCGVTALPDRWSYGLPSVSDVDEECLFAARLEDMGDAVPAGSVDAVITAPPIDDTGIAALRSLATLSVHCLKPGGLMVVACSNSRLDQYLSLLSVRPLRYCWTFMWSFLTSEALGTPCGESNLPIPIVVFRKGGKGPLRRFANGDADLERGRFAFQDIVNCFAHPGQVVFDPMMGSGTTGVCALRRRCLFIGSDADPVCVETARRRLGDLRKSLQR